MSDDKNIFRLPTAAFAQFQSSLDSPAEPNDKLRELLQEPDQFVVHRLRSKPVEYTVAIKHFVSGGEWTMSVTVQDVSDDDTNRERVASDLRRAAEMLHPHQDDEK